MQAAGFPAAFAYAADRLVEIGDRKSMALRRFAEVTMLPNSVHCHRFAQKQVLRRGSSYVRPLVTRA